MEHDISFGNSNRENGPTFLDFPLFLGIFQWDEPTKRVPFTAEPEIPEILTKWKAPTVSQTPTRQIRHTDAIITFVTQTRHTDANKICTPSTETNASNPHARTDRTNSATDEWHPYTNA